MWPKALAQLIELAPHITRLVPVADRFLNTKTASEEASRSAMEQMAEGLRGDLGQVTAAHAGLYRQLNEQSEKLNAIAAEVHATSLSAEALEARLAVIEQKNSRLMLILVVAIMMLAAVCILSGLILTRLR